MRDAIGLIKFEAKFVGWIPKIEVFLDVITEDVIEAVIDMLVYMSARSTAEIEDEIIVGQVNAVIPQDLLVQGDDLLIGRELVHRPGPINATSLSPT